MFDVRPYGRGAPHTRRERCRVNGFGYYRAPSDPKSVVLQGDLPAAVARANRSGFGLKEPTRIQPGTSSTPPNWSGSAPLGGPSTRFPWSDGSMLIGTNVPARAWIDSGGRVTLRYGFAGGKGIYRKRPIITVARQSRPDPNRFNSRNQAWAGFQLCGSNSASRVMGCSPMRERTSLNQA